jgi:hypothetical protein
MNTTQRLTHIQNTVAKNTIVKTLTEKHGKDLQTAIKLANATIK